jgi:class 3 adenylate cyclase/CHASE2 domain-containing sensor protein
MHVKSVAILMMGAMVAAYGCFWSLPGVFQIWNAQTIDRLFLLRSNLERVRPAYTGIVAHVDFNNSSIERLGQHYLSRKHFARVVRNLASMGVAAQVFDFIFAARLDEADDLALIDAVKEAGNVYFGIAFELLPPDQTQKQKRPPSKGKPFIGQMQWTMAFKGERGSLYEAINPLATFHDLALASRGLGSLSVKFDRDGVLRRVPLLVRYQQGFYPSLAFRAVCDYLSVSPENIALDPGKHLLLRNAKRPGSEKGKDITIPIDENGNMIVNYLGPWGTMDHYSFADILHASEDQEGLKTWREELKGRIVIVSDVTTGSSDVGPVPTDADFPLSGAHAQVIHNILTRSFLRELSGWEMLALELAMMAIVFILATRFSSIPFSIGAILLASTFSGFAAAGFFYMGVILNVIRPLLMLGFATVATILFRYIQEEKEKLETLRQRDFIRGTFGRYLSNEVVDEVLDRPGGLKMSGEIREVTFLVSDLRGFTALTSRLPPVQVIEIMNRYFERMIDIIARYRGTVKEFQGDGILAFFGAPLRSTDDPHRAVACAIAMQNAMELVNAEHRRLDLPELGMGIGINTGDAVVGNIGSEKRASYGAIGTPINLAYRIESYTVGGQIFISASTYEKVQSLVKVRDTKEVWLKGIDQKLMLYDVVGMAGSYAISLPEMQEDVLFTLDPPLLLTCFPFAGKASSGSSVAGQIMALGEHGAMICLAQGVESYSNLKLLLSSPGSDRTIEISAKVLGERPSDGAAFPNAYRIQFTWLTAEAKSFLGEVRAQRRARLV